MDALREISPTAAAGSGPGWARSTALLQRLVDTHAPRAVGAEAVLLAALGAALDAERCGAVDAQGARRRLSRAVQEYVQAVFLSGLPSPGPGAPRGGIDLDGVLEVDPLGFPYLTPVAALALRGLRAHGYELLLATGRSIGHVRDRAATYGLGGGVAEYGSVTYVHSAGVDRSLVPPEARAALERIRAALRGLPGVQVDAGYTHVVRAFEPRPDGPRRALGAEQVAIALAAAGPVGIRVVAASTQTDFVAHGVDKGKGLVALLATLDGAPAAHETPFAFAIGDSAEDLPMLRMAARPFAPANAEEAVGAAGVPVMAGRCQHGFADAVTALLGHHPGSCPACRLPDQPPERRRVLALLGRPDRR